MSDTDNLRYIAKRLASRLSVTRQDGNVVAALLASIADGGGPPSTQALSYIAALAIYAKEREDELDRVLKSGTGWKPIHTAPEHVPIVVGAYETKGPNEFLVTEAYLDGGVWYDTTRSPGIDFEPTHWTDLPSRPR